MPSCNMYHISWVSLTLTWGISSQLLQQSTAAPPYLELGVLTTTIPDLQSWIAPLGPPVPGQPPLLRLLLPAAGPGLGLWVAPQGHCPWSRARGGLWLLLATPDLGVGMSPPGHHWPQTQGRLLQATTLTPDTGCLLLAATDLGRRVAPLGHSRAVAAWHSRPLPLTSEVG